MSARTTKPSNGKTVSLVFRDYLLLIEPCHHRSTHPSALLNIIFEHTLVCTADEKDLVIYRTWQPGKRVNAGYGSIGYSHVALYFESTEKITIILNGTVQTCQLETSEKMHKEPPGYVNRNRNPMIRKAIAEAFGGRIVDFKPYLKEWECKGSGLRTHSRGVVNDLPKKFTPKGWDPRKS